MDVCKRVVDFALQAVGLHEFFRFKFLYLIIYAGFGVLMPYAPVYYEVMSMSKAQIGILTMMPNLCSFLIAPLFSIIGDIFHAHYELIIICIIASTASTTATLLCKSFWQFCTVVLVASIMRAPVSPNIDALVISSLSKKSRYGEMRLWGAISFGICSLIGGVITSTPSEGNPDGDSIQSLRWLFFLHAFFFLATGFIVLWLIYAQTNPPIVKSGDIEMTATTNPLTVSAPFTAPSTPDISTPIEPEPPKVSIFTALYRVFSVHPSVGIFSLIVFLSGFGSGVIDAFLFLRLKQLGGSGLVMGISRFITCAAEVPMFQIAGPLQQKYGTWPMLALTQFAFVVRFTYYSFLTIPWAVLPCEVLHGLTFAVTWSVSCTYANMISPPECHSTMQSLLEGLHWGIGSGMGALIGGYAYDSFGAVRLFEASGILSFCSMLLALLAWMLHADSDNYHRNTSTHYNQSPGREQQSPVRYDTVRQEVEEEDVEEGEIVFDINEQLNCSNTGKTASASLQ